MPTRCCAGDQLNITPGGPKQRVQNLHTKHTDLLETQQKLHTNFVFDRPATGQNKAVVWFMSLLCLKHRRINKSIKEKGAKCKEPECQKPRWQQHEVHRKTLTHHDLLHKIFSGQASLCHSSAFLIGKTISHLVFGALKLIHPSAELKQPPRVTLGSQLSGQHPVRAASLHSSDQLWMLPRSAQPSEHHPVTVQTQQLLLQYSHLTLFRI